MASLRRSKALSPDGQTARFLYTILKQLDLKTIDWNLVADGLDITNGHAARMRFSRFKQHMEGIPTQPRTPRNKKDGIKDKNAKGKGLKRGLDGDVKGEEMKGEDGDADEARFKVKLERGFRIKDESGLNEETDVEGPPAVRVKREPEADGIASHTNSAPTSLTSPIQGQELALLTNLLSAPPAALTTHETSPIMSPPIATVSLADLHLSPPSIPHPPRYDRAAPSFLFTAAPVTPGAHRDLTVAGLKSEPGLMSGPTPAASVPLHVKSEPLGP